MKFTHLAKLFYEWGWQINHEHYVSFSDYVKEMVKRNRVIVLEKDNEIEAVIFFFLTYDYTKIYKKRIWDVVIDDAAGHQLYIDKMICKKFNRTMFREIKEAIEDALPQVELGVYHRAPKDKCIKIKTRSAHAIQG